MRRYRLATTLATIALLLAVAFVGSTIMSAIRLARSQARLLNQQAKLQEVLNVYLRLLWFGDAKEPDATKALIQRALVLRQQGDLTGARELYLRAETAYTRQLGPNHPILATLFNNLGRLEKEAERHEAAAEY